MSSPEHVKCECFEEGNSKIHNGIPLLAPADPKDITFPDCLRQEISIEEYKYPIFNTTPTPNIFPPTLSIYPGDLPSMLLRQECYHREHSQTRATSLIIITH